MWPLVAQATLLGVERPIASYGVMLSLGLVCSTLLFVRLARREGILSGDAIVCAVVAVGTGLLGSNLLFAAVELVRVGEVPWREGRFGLVFLGGAVGGCLGLGLACRWLSLPFPKAADSAAVSLALGHALGRIGCVLGGCCYGVQWHGLDGHGLLALTYTHPLAPAAVAQVPRFPTQLFEAALVLLLAGYLWQRRAKRKWPPGGLALRYGLGYATLRLVTEPLRGDAVRGLMLDGTLSTSQLLSAIVIATGGWMLWQRRRSATLSITLLGLLIVSWGFLADARAQLTMQAPSTIRIGAGWFTMGSSDADVEDAVQQCQADLERSDLCRAELFENERPARRVYLSSYRIDRTEVDNASYRRCVAANVCPPPQVSDADPRLAAPEHPVTGVTYRDAQRFCDWLGGTLPTEAQWEKAARGTTPRAYPWGNLWNSRIANHGRGMGGEDPVDGYDYAAPVDAFVDSRSPFGLLNMAGNAAEMVADYYDNRGYVDAGRIDPRGPDSGSERVVRGGSWRTPPFTLRTTHRIHVTETEPHPDVGFRCSYPP